MAPSKNPVGARTGAIFSILCFLLAACGGGGGGGNDNGNGGVAVPPGSTPINDLETPRIIAVAPAPNSVDQDRGTSVVIHFEVPVDIASLQGGVFSVSTGDGPLDGNQLLADGGTTLVFNPEGGMPLSAEPRVLLKAGVRDLAGNQRQNDFEFSFRTRETAPLPPSPFENESDQTSLRDLRLADDGTGVAVYVKRGVVNNELIAQRFEGGFPTGLPDTLFTTSGSIDLGPQGVAVARGRQATVAWRVTSAGDPNAFAAFLNPATLTWETEELENESTRGADLPLAAVMASGRSLVIWLEEPLTGTDPIVRNAIRFSPSGSMLIDNHGAVAPASGLSMAMNEDGNGVIAYIEEVSPTTFDVKVSGILGGQPLLPVDVETRTNGFERETTSSVDANGRGLVAWIERDSVATAERVLAVFGDPGLGNWSDDIVLQTALEIRQLKVAGAEETGVVFWGATISGANRIFGVRLDPNNGFGDAETLSGVLSDVEIGTSASNVRGDLLLGLVNAQFQVHAVCWPVDGAPSGNVPVSLGPPHEPQVALEPSGAGLIVYAVHNLQADPQQGSHAVVRRIRADGTLESEQRLLQPNIPSAVNRLRVDVDGQGLGTALVNMFTPGVGDLDIFGVLLQ